MGIHAHRPIVGLEHGLRDGHDAVVGRVAKGTPPPRSSGRSGHDRSGDPNRGELREDLLASQQLAHLPIHDPVWPQVPVLLCQERRALRCAKKDQVPWLVPGLTERGPQEQAAE